MIQLSSRDLSIFLIIRRRPQISTLFPYTTLFRSEVSDTAMRVHQDIALIGFTITELAGFVGWLALRSEEHTSELQSRLHLVCRLLLEKKNIITRFKHGYKHMLYPS